MAGGRERSQRARGGPPKATWGHPPGSPMASGPAAPVSVPSAIPKALINFGFWGSSSGNFPVDHLEHSLKPQSEGLLASCRVFRAPSGPATHVSRVGEEPPHATPRTPRTAYLGDTVLLNLRNCTSVRRSTAAAADLTAVTTSPYVCALNRTEHLGLPQCRMSTSSQ